MIIAVGHFRLAKRKRIFSFLKLSKQIEKQAKNTSGNIQVELSGASLNSFFVLSTWEDEKAMKEFVHSSFHLEGLQKSKELAAEIRLLHFESNQIPNFKAAKEMLNTNPATRTYKF